MYRILWNKYVCVSVWVGQSLSNLTKNLIMVCFKIRFKVKVSTKDWKKTCACARKKNTQTTEECKVA